MLISLRADRTWATGLASYMSLHLSQTESESLRDFEWLKHNVFPEIPLCFYLNRVARTVNEWMAFPTELIVLHAEITPQCFPYALLQSLSPRLISRPSSVCDFHSLILNPPSWLLLTLITHLCYFCSCAFKIQLFSFSDFLFFFFFSSGAFFEGPLLMQFPVILLALSLNLNWLRWSCLGPSPRPWLHKPACDISGPCTISSSLWILPACAAPWCSLYNSLCGQAVRVNRLWQVVNQYENKGMGKGGDKKIQRTNWTWEAKRPSDWAVWQGIKMFPFLCVYKKNLFCADSQEQIRGLCEEILRPLSSLFDKTSTHHPTREQDMLTVQCPLQVKFLSWTPTNPTSIHTTLSDNFHSYKLLSGTKMSVSFFYSCSQHNVSSFSLRA